MARPYNAQMYSYQTIGHIYPLDRHLSLSETKLAVHWQGRRLVVNYSIEAGRIFVGAQSPAAEDPHDLMFLCEQVVQNFLNSVAFSLGIVGEAYIEAIRGTDGAVTRRELATTTVKAGKLADALFAEVMRVPSCAAGPLGHYIVTAFDDFRMALRRPLDTAFHCFRAIESLRNYCAAKYNLGGKEKKVQWAKLRELAECTVDDIAPITKRSRESRHGDFKGLDGAERNDIIQRTRKIVGTFLRNEFPPAPAQEQEVT